MVTSQVLYCNGLRPVMYCINRNVAAQNPLDRRSKIDTLQQLKVVKVEEVIKWWMNIRIL